MTLPQGGRRSRVARRPPRRSAGFDGGAVRCQATVAGQRAPRPRAGHRLGALSGAPHGLIVLAGPPDTDKTTLVQGLAQQAAQAIAHRGATTFVEVDPHAFPSDLLGESQRAVMRLFNDTLPELAARRPHTIALVDDLLTLLEG